MKIRFRLDMAVVFLAPFLAAASPLLAQVRPGGKAIESRFAEVDGVSRSSQGSPASSPSSHRTCPGLAIRTSPRMAST
jgi:hypothetical protein